ncbi:MAG: hypothetical protein WD278_13620 [Pirellulales bacterium]
MPPSRLGVRQPGQELSALEVAGRVGAIRTGGSGPQPLKLILVASDAVVHRHHQIDALAWVRAVSDNVAQAADLVDSLPANIRQHRLERGKVAVDIADDGSLHAHRLMSK